MTDAPQEQIEGEPTDDVQEPLLAGLALPPGSAYDITVDGSGAVVRLTDASGQTYTATTDAPKIGQSIIPKSLLPHDLFTHQRAWREAIVKARSASARSEDVRYWDHELTAFDRTWDALDRLTRQS